MCNIDFIWLTYWTVFHFQHITIKIMIILIKKPNLEFLAIQNLTAAKQIYRDRKKNAANINWFELNKSLQYFSNFFLRVRFYNFTLQFISIPWNEIEHFYIKLIKIKSLKINGRNCYLFHWELSWWKP